MLLIILLSIAAGASVVIARNINSILADKLGLLLGTFYNHSTGFVVSAVIFLISGESIIQAFNHLAVVPAWAYFGGLLGVIIVALSSFVTPKMSAFYISLIIFIGQLFTGIIIDYFALESLSLGKIIGGLLVVAGLMYNLNLDKKEAVKS